MARIIQPPFLRIIPLALPNRLLHIPPHRTKSLHLLHLALVLLFNNLITPPSHRARAPAARTRLSDSRRRAGTAAEAGADVQQGPFEGGFLALGEDEAGGRRGAEGGGFVVWGGEGVGGGGADDADVGGEGGGGGGGGEDFDGVVGGAGGRFGGGQGGGLDGGRSGGGGGGFGVRVCVVDAADGGDG